MRRRAFFTEVSLWLALVCMPQFNLAAFNPHSLQEELDLVNSSAGVVGTVREVGLRHVALANRRPEWYDEALKKRLALRAMRADRRAQAYAPEGRSPAINIEVSDSQAEPAESDAEIDLLTKMLAKHRKAGKSKEAKLEDPSAQWNLRETAAVHRLARSRAFTGICTKRRVYHTLPTSRPDIDTSTEYLAKPSCEGGLRAVAVEIIPQILHAELDTEGDEESDPTNEETNCISTAARDEAAKDSEEIRLSLRAAGRRKFEVGQIRELAHPLALLLQADLEALRQSRMGEELAYEWQGSILELLFNQGAEYLSTSIIQPQQTREGADGLGGCDPGGHLRVGPVGEDREVLRGRRRQVSAERERQADFVRPDGGLQADPRQGLRWQGPAGLP